MVSVLAGLVLPLLLAVSPWYVPQTTSVTTQPIVFRNAGAVLRGTLYLPASARKVPAVIVFHGASEPLASTLLYRHLRQGLPQLGIAVLLFDRRGTGASSGATNVSYETFADDGIAGAHAIARLPQINAQRIGYWGISQGGWLATFAAVRDPNAAFAVAVSAPLVTPETQMQFAMSNRLHALGYSQADIAEMLNARKAWTGYLRGQNSRSDAVSALAKIEKKPWFDLMYLPTSEELGDPRSSGYRQQMDDDPFAVVQRVKIPMLFILGAEDPWVPVGETLNRLQGIAQSHPLMSYTVIPDANHLMMFPPVPERMTDADPKAVAVEAPQSPAYFMRLGEWLTRILRLGS